MARLFISAGASVIPKPGGNEVLTLAGETRWDPGLIKLLLDKGAPGNGKGIASRTALHNLVISHEPDEIFSCVNTLIAAGADVEIRDDQGLTALHLAGSLGAARDVLGILLRHGSNVNRKDNEGTSALQEAVKARLELVVATLPSAGAEVNIRGISGYSAID